MPPAAHPDSYYVATAVGLTDHPVLAGSLDCDVGVVGAAKTT